MMRRIGVLSVLGLQKGSIVKLVSLVIMETPSMVDNVNVCPLTLLKLNYVPS